ncbi:MAG TPA: glycosyltransferase family 9 protein [Bacteroidota bacterium]|nr:glycosyltransferase family 9 protein [Bacteroidota bacterium]
MPTKILIIKLGYSETLDSEIGKIVSLGDVLRATVMLGPLKEKYPDSHLTWLVSERAEPLLVQNPFIDRILTWDQFVPFQLMREKFDIVINLEKVPGVCAVADMIDAWTKYGFRFDSVRGTYDAYEKGRDFISYIETKKTRPAKTGWQQVMVEMLGGVEWSGQRYVIGYRPKTELTFDVGLNFEVGPKWPAKGMPLGKWKSLERKLLDAGLSLSWQRGQGDLYEYMDWINSCRVLVTSDSLGLHIAFAYERNVVGLFGPTDPSEIYLYDGSVVLRSQCGCKEMPCWLPRCTSGLDCMSNIDPDEIVRQVQTILTNNRSKSFFRKAANA